MHNHQNGKEELAHERICATPSESSVLTIGFEPKAMLPGQVTRRGPAIPKAEQHPRHPVMFTCVTGRAILSDSPHRLTRAIPSLSITVVS